MLYVFLFYPKTKGALVIYNSFLKPYLRSKEQKIDDLITKGKDAVNQKLLNKMWEEKILIVVISQNIRQISLLFIWCDLFDFAKWKCLFHMKNVLKKLKKKKV